MPNVIVSNVGKHHAYETAWALQNKGWLKRLYTSFYAEKEPSFKHHLLRSALPRSLQTKISNRYDERLDCRLITSYFFPEILERTPLKKWIGAYNTMNIKAELYDYRVSISDLECDVFHGFEGAVLYSMRAAKKNGAITVLDQPIFHHETSREIMIKEYEIWDIPPPKGLFERDINIIRKEKEIAEADYVLVPTKKIAEDFIEKGKSANKILTIPYGFNSSRFGIGKKEDDKFRILFIGIVGFRKGILYLLEAFKQLNLKNAELIVISPVDEDIKPLIKKYEKLFKYIQSVPNNEIVKYYNNSSVFVFPSLVEGSAYVTFEAMASGLPVITTENSGSVIHDEKHGFLIPIRSVDALKEKILFLYNNEKIRLDMGRTAAEFIGNFTWERYHQQLQYVYQNIIMKSK
jgi:glycosyltransferase involved in cell wall biosynthesis